MNIRKKIEANILNLGYENLNADTNESMVMYAGDDLLSVVVKFLIIAFEKHKMLTSNYKMLVDMPNDPANMLTDQEVQLFKDLQSEKLIAFMVSHDGITFVKHIVIAQANRDTCDWILLARCF